MELNVTIDKIFYKSVWRKALYTILTSVRLDWLMASLTGVSILPYKVIKTDLRLVGAVLEGKQVQQGEFDGTAFTLFLPEGRLLATRTAKGKLGKILGYTAISKRTEQVDVYTNHRTGEQRPLTDIRTGIYEGDVQDAQGI